MLIQNQIKCLSCGDEIWSAHRHDYKTCSCGNVSVDGATDYCKRSFKSKDQYIEQSIYLSEETVNAAIAAVKWGLETGRNERGIAYAVIRALNETGNLNQGKD